MVNQLVTEYMGTRTVYVNSSESIIVKISVYTTVIYFKPFYIFEKYKLPVSPPIAWDKHPQHNSPLA